jgi:hypothetical protein
VILAFSERRASDVEKASEIGVSVPRESFGDVSWARSGSVTNLAVVVTISFQRWSF